MSSEEQNLQPINETVASRGGVPHVQKPSVGRIVFVRPSGWKDEVPAIVTRVHTDECINVRAFTDDSDNPIWVTSCMPQSLSPEGYGWRWPPRV